MTSRSNVPSLSIVIPVYNEPDWIGRSVGALRVALENARWDAEIVVVDDGSTDDTPARLAELPGVTVLTQPNGGRFAARLAGITKASGDLVLMLDSRVIMDPGSLVFLRDQLAEHPERTVWNGHINADTTGNPYGAFMQGLVAVAWRRYAADPRLTSFTAEDFDAYPKGTTLFVAPRKVLEEAAMSFSSLYDDVRLASDDTRMLRWIAEQGPIFIAPGFAAEYNSRDSLPKFTKHAYFRGSTFVDGYLDSPGPVRNAAFAAAGVGVAGLVLLLRKPKLAVALAAAGSAAAGAVVRKSGGTKDQSLAVAKLLTLFAACFGAGAARGLALALRKRLGR
ncbi:glycosyltransferase [Actinosynnema sp. NPDC047251]|uniref:Glycosyltransferase, family 2 n=1 Tax=Saccharothrix espanaensis (strain ATCC 51144 / DSM 44229 / JCM 9112 / NBRC 15066 / NRRL 15764) TaxID=1179773 RepID=K3W472_SACES|nr:glycosyltransferase family 2 protein [Saccharothrix espanaensis]CCH27492.1 Glycosyltransferase, family 2 [Saccharothrix espanaensis DSM 44229]